MDDELNALAATKTTESMLALTNMMLTRSNLRTCDPEMRAACDYEYKRALRELIKLLPDRVPHG